VFSTGGSVCSHLLTLVRPKRRFKQDLHGATSQKTAFSIVTAVKTSNLTYTLKFTLRSESSLLTQTAPHCSDVDSVNDTFKLIYFVQQHLLNISVVRYRANSALTVSHHNSLDLCSHVSTVVTSSCKSFE
jgi:hypothetical protein